MSGAYAVLHDPQGLLDAELPLDRAPHEALVTAVLAWKDPDLAPCDYEQIALQLTGHARAVAADVRRLAAALPRAVALHAAGPPHRTRPGQHIVRRGSAPRSQGLHAHQCDAAAQNPRGVAPQCV
ncbi:hypothetical protein [Streptomyces sp. NPDC020141]|uniref:hypothetical protein n=1 Tax=Streptomyces sp. NPDC020141 TaxID=3365065 RepID=UPI0037A88787